MNRLNLLNFFWLNNFSIFSFDFKKNERKMVAPIFWFKKHIYEEVTILWLKLKLKKKYFLFHLPFPGNNSKRSGNGPVKCDHFNSKLFKSIIPHVVGVIHLKKVDNSISQIMQSLQWWTWNNGARFRTSADWVLAMFLHTLLTEISVFFPYLSSAHVYYRNDGQIKLFSFKLLYFRWKQYSSRRGRGIKGLL